MRPPTYVVAIVGTALAVGWWGCGYVCNEPGCDTGLLWTGLRIADEPLAEGPYRLLVELERTSFEVHCTVELSVSQSSCSSPERTGGDGDFALYVHIHGSEDAPDVPSEFLLDAGGYSGPAEDTPEGPNRGPTLVRIALEHEDALLVDVTYELEYERDDDYFGDPRCGYCDERQFRRSKW